MAIKDLIIIGAGPAGITAAVYAARKQLDFTVISRDVGGQAAWSGEIENYTGYQFISGPELAQKFKEHMEKYSFDIKEGVGVTRVTKENDIFRVTTDKAGELEAKTLIIASGKRPRLLNVPGESKYKNKGLNFCATCDAPLFSGKDTAVIGGGNSGLDAVLQLMKISPRVYLINDTDSLTGDAVMQKKVKAAPNVEILNNARVKEVRGEKFLNAIVIEHEGKAKTIAVQGVFVEIGLVPNSEFVDLAVKNDKGEIKIDCAARTPVPGLFAAGDVTDVPAKQIIVAAGDGAKALLSAFRYLSTH